MNISVLLMCFCNLAIVAGIIGYYLKCEADPEFCKYAGNIPEIFLWSFLAGSILFCFILILIKRKESVIYQFEAV